MEFHFDDLKHLMSPRVDTDPNKLSARVDVETKGGHKFCLVLTNKSMAMPVTVHSGGDPKINEIAEQNLKELNLAIGETHLIKANSIMGFALNANNDGLVVALQNADDAMFLHFFPKNPTGTQEEFITLTKTVFESRGMKLSVGEPL